MRKVLAAMALILTLSAGASAQETDNEPKAEESAVLKEVKPTSTLARAVFRHKYNSKFNRTLNFSKFQTLYKLMPRKLKKEVGQVYYPRLYNDLHKSDSTTFLKAEASKSILQDSTMLIKLSFPNFFLNLEHVTWKDLDSLFLTYFKQK